MNNTIIMYSKKLKTDVIVYNVTASNNGISMATIFVPSIMAKDNLAGWRTVNINTLIPMEYKEMYLEIVETAELREIARKRLEISGWKTSDGTVYSLQEHKLAIDHELKLMEENKNETLASKTNPASPKTTVVGATS